MVAVVKRMRTLRALLSVRLGKGAAVLSPEVTRIHMEFALKSRDGHGSAKQFWRKYLPRLKYHNPSIPMTVTRTSNQEGPASLTVHFTSPSEASSPSQVTSTTTKQTSSVPPTKTESGPATERTETIDIKMRTESGILDQLYKLTKAVPIKPTAEEAREIKEMNEGLYKSRQDQLQMEEVLRKIKREKAVLAAARGEVQAAREH